ncbi:MAG: LamG domain-containing protein, partial [Nanoarchaeota archaeon]|nr:LamG domain-containing protein [Nanoarchaeota archaeon]
SFGLDDNPPRALFCQVTTSEGELGLGGTGELSDLIIGGNVWSHVACTYDDSTGVMALYVNGVKIISEDFGDNLPIIASDNVLSIGGFGVGNDHYRGSIDELSIYGEALSIEQIKEIYEAGNLGKCRL